MKELEDRRACLRHGHDGRNDNGENGKREGERAAASECAARTAVRQSLAHAGGEIGRGRKLDAAAKLHECEL